MGGPQGTYNTTLVAGADFDRTGTLKYKATGLPWDLTGWEARMQMRDDTDTLVAEWVSGGLTPTVGPHGTGAIALGGAEGTVSWTTPASVTGALPEGTYRHDLLLIDPAGKVYAPWRGTITVLAPVTRNP